MPVTFDGVTRTITEIAAGTDNTLDVVDVYSEWKRWQLLSDNLKYPQAFRQVGGDPITSTQNLGTTFFLNTPAGWRIRPAELSHTLTLVGNVLPEGGAGDIFTDTLGAFTVRTRVNFSNLVDSSVARLDLNQLLEAVFVNVADGTAGTGPDVGTPTNPSNNLADALTIAASRRLRTLRIQGNLTLDRDISGFRLSGEATSGPNVLNLNGRNIEGCTFNNLLLQGTMTGQVALAENCSLDILVGLDGRFQDCTLLNDLALDMNADVQLVDCTTNEAGLETTIHFNAGAQLVLHDFTGNASFNTLTATCLVVVNGDGSRVRIDDSSTGGTVIVRGLTFIEDDTAGLVTIVDERLIGEASISELDKDDIARRVRDVPLAAASVGSLGEALAVVEAVVGKQRLLIDEFAYNADGFATTCRIRVFGSEADAAAATPGGSGEGEIRTATITGVPAAGFPVLPRSVRGVGA